jgi:NADH-quinone oxidoreductase subunit A
MATPTAIVAYLLLFTIAGALFLFANLLIGRFLRPYLPNQEKLEVYECGEPVIGSSFVQFDLRFYVVALLFIIFDVEVAFFFPWATVFGKATQLMADDTPVLASDMVPNGSTSQLSPLAEARLQELGIQQIGVPQLDDTRATQLGASAAGEARNRAAVRDVARRMALVSFADIGVFFAVLLVGFAYVWKRGDLDWVRAITQEYRPRVERPRTTPPRAAPSESILSA